MPQVVEALGHDNPQVRRVAATVLGKIDGVGLAGRALLALLNDPDPDVRQAAADAVERSNRA